MSKPEIEVKFNEQNPAQPPIPPRVPQVTGMIKTVDEEPTGTPRSFFEQFRIFDNILYWYDTEARGWFNTGGGGGTPAGNDSDIQFNDDGSFGAEPSGLFQFVKSTLTLWVRRIQMQSAYINGDSGGVTYDMSRDTTNVPNGFNIHTIGDDGSNAVYGTVGYFKVSDLGGGGSYGSEVRKSIFSLSTTNTTPVEAKAVAFPLLNFHSVLVEVRAVASITTSDTANSYIRQALFKRNDSTGGFLQVGSTVDALTIEDFGRTGSDLEIIGVSSGGQNWIVPRVTGESGTTCNWYLEVTVLVT
jgi:hypothetical protein